MVPPLLFTDESSGEVVLFDWFQWLRENIVPLSEGSQGSPEKECLEHKSDQPGSPVETKKSQNNPPVSAVVSLAQTQADIPTWIHG